MREVDPEVVAVIARLAAGGMRDAESILDQLLASPVGPVTADAGATSWTSPTPSPSTCSSPRWPTATPPPGSGCSTRLEDRGRDLPAFLDQVVDAIRERLLEGLASRSDDASLVTAARRLGAIDPTRLGPAACACSSSWRCSTRRPCLRASHWLSRSPAPFRAPRPEPAAPPAKATNP